MLGHIAPLRQRANVYYRGIRVGDWFGYLGMSAVGYALGVATTPSSAFDHWLIARSALSCAFFLAFCFLINNYADVDGDRLDPGKVEKNPIAAGLIRPENALALSIAIATCGFLISVTLPNLLSLGLYLALVILGWAYSVPPLRLKGRPVADVVSHGFMLGVFLFLFGLSAATTELLSRETLLVGASMFTASAIFELRNHLHDISADTLSGTLTTVGWLGESASRRLLLAITVCHLVLLSIILFSTTSYAIYLAPMGAVLLAVLVLNRAISPERALDCLAIGVYAMAAIPKVALLLIG